MGIFTALSGALYYEQRAGTVGMPRDVWHVLGNAIA